MDIELPNGVIIEDVPEGTSKDEVMRRAIAAGHATSNDFSADFSIGEMARNTPSSLSRFGYNTAMQVLHPVDTLANIAKLGVSGIGHAASALGADIEPRVLEPGSQMVEGLKERYGGMNATKRTLMEDPVGAAADLAGILSGAGGGLRAARLPMLGKSMQTVGAVIDPLQNIGRAAMLAKKMALGTAPAQYLGKRMYQSAMEFKDPAVMAEAYKRGIRPEDLDLVDAQRKLASERINDIVNATNESAPASGLFKGMEDRFDQLPTPDIGVGDTQRGYSSFMNKLAKHTGYVAPSTREGFHGVLDLEAPVKAPSAILDASGMPIYAAKPESHLGYEPGVDPNGHRQDIHKFKVSGWDALYKDNGMPVKTSPGMGRGRQAGRELATRNANKILRDALQGYESANAEYGKLANIQRELKPISNTFSKIDPISSGRYTLSPSLGGSLGFAMGGVPGALMGTAGAGILNALHTDRRSVNMALGIRNAARRPTAKEMVFPVTNANTTLNDILVRLEDERNRQLGNAIRGIR